MKTKKKKLFIGFCRGCLTEVSVKKKHVTENPINNFFFFMLILYDKKAVNQRALL
jgi:hypothetical protein